MTPSAHSTQQRRVRAVVSGRVQGVGFRYFVLRRATDLDLSGWVRNRADGSVEILAEGPPEALRELVRVLRVGPPSAYVADVKMGESEAEGGLPKPFAVEPDAYY